MENIKILVRPEAYKLLSDPLQSKQLESVFGEAIKVAQCSNGKRRKVAYVPFTEILLVMRWATLQGKESIILISSFQEQNLFNLLDPDELELAIQEGIQIPFV